MDNKYYIAINDNERKGPYTIQELKGMITPETKLWNKSLPTWMLASEIPEVQYILENREETSMKIELGYNPPSSWLLASFLTFFFFNIIIGAIAIFHATKVDDNYLLGNKNEAKEHSRKAKLFVVIGIAVGIILRPIILNLLYSAAY